MFRDHETETETLARRKKLESGTQHCLFACEVRGSQSCNLSFLGKTALLARAYMADEYKDDEGLPMDSYGKDSANFTSSNPMNRSPQVDSVIDGWWRQKHQNISKGGGKRSYIAGREIGLRFGTGKWPEKDTEQ